MGTTYFTVFNLDHIYMLSILSDLRSHFGVLSSMNVFYVSQTEVVLEKCKLDDPESVASIHGLPQRVRIFLG